MLEGVGFKYADGISVSMKFALLGRNILGGVKKTRRRILFLLILLLLEGEDFNSDILNVRT